MKKYADLYYTTAVVGFKERNNSTPIRMYKFFIWSKEGKRYKIIQESDEEYDDKAEAELAAIETIKDDADCD